MTRLIDWECALGARFRRLRRPGSFVAFVLVSVYGVLQVAKLNEWPRASFWEAGTWGSRVFVAFAILATLASLLLILGYRRLLPAAKEARELDSIARGVVHVLEKRTRLRPTEMGVNVWLLQGPRGFRRLERRARAVERETKSTPIVWTKGKGVIGRCWARGETTFADLAEFRRRYGHRRAFCELSRDERFRFTWQEFQDTKRYRAVLAVPLRPRIYGRYRMRGVLAVHVTTAGKEAELDGIQEHADFSRLIRTLEKVLGDLDE